MKFFLLFELNKKQHNRCHRHYTQSCCYHYFHFSTPTFSRKEKKENYLKLLFYTFIFISSERWINQRTSTKLGVGVGWMRKDRSSLIAQIYTHKHPKWYLAGKNNLLECIRRIWQIEILYLFLGSHPSRNITVFIDTESRKFSLSM